ncbi:Hypothetical predicted protein [Marmota monax]|uniref:Uncharacterized protein n=1 Tax=Marmota monax TaxID=9995 RepID=A0A5E4C9X8_MARMO|nr:Hypothetical predicted protein [Marmota monax]
MSRTRGVGLCSSGFSAVCSIRACGCQRCSLMFLGGTAWLKDTTRPSVHTHTSGSLLVVSSADAWVCACWCACFLLPGPAETPGVELPSPAGVCLPVVCTAGGGGSPKAAAPVCPSRAVGQVRHPPAWGLRVCQRWPSALPQDAVEKEPCARQQSWLVLGQPPGSRSLSHGGRLSFQYYVFISRSFDVGQLSALPSGIVPSSPSSRGPRSGLSLQLDGSAFGLALTTPSEQKRGRGKPTATRSSLRRGCARFLGLDGGPFVGTGNCGHREGSWTLRGKERNHLNGRPAVALRRFKVLWVSAVNGNNTCLRGNVEQHLDSTLSRVSSTSTACPMSGLEAAPQACST